MSVGNSTLVKHGIDEDESDYRLHIGFASGKAYLFPTASGRDVLRGNPQYETFKVSQPGVGVATGAGYKVPWKNITGCQELLIPPDALAEVCFSRDDNPSAKGQKAITVAKELLRRGLIPLPLLAREIQEHDMQVRGKDLIVTSRLTLQVKCDYWCSQYGISLQTHECNPLRRH